MGYFRLCIETDTGLMSSIVNKKFTISENKIALANRYIADFAARNIMDHCKYLSLKDKICAMFVALKIKRAITLSCFEDSQNYSPLLNILMKHSADYMYSQILYDTIVFIYKIGNNRIDYFEIDKKKLLHAMTKDSNNRLFFTYSTKE